MGRPRKKASDEMNNRITIRFTDKELSSVKLKAASLKMSSSEYIREMIKHGKVYAYEEPSSCIDSIKPLTEEFHKIGFNLNQIAHHLNSGKELTEAIRHKLLTLANELHELNIKVNEQIR